MATLLFSLKKKDKGDLNSFFSGVELGEILEMVFLFPDDISITAVSHH